MSSIPVFFGHVIKLKPFEEEVYDDVIKELLVLQAEVVLCMHGYCGGAGCANWRKLAILLAFLKIGIKQYL